MKTLRTIGLLFVMLAVTAGVSAQNFEGKIRFKMIGQERPSRNTSSDSTSFMTQYIKGGMIRVDMEMDGGRMMGGMIMDTAKREMTMLMVEQKMYMVMKMPEPKPTADTAASQSDVELIRTGETETILGYKCEKMIVKNKNGETDVWGAEGLGTYQSMAAGGPMGRPAPKSAWEAALAERGFFPLRVVSKDKSGKEVMRMEAVSLDKQSLPDSTFLPPADFQKFSMPSIPGLSGMNPFGSKS